MAVGATVGDEQALLDCGDARDAPELDEAFAKVQDSIAAQAAAAAAAELAESERRAASERAVRAAMRPNLWPAAPHGW